MTIYTKKNLGGHLPFLISLDLLSRRLLNLHEENNHILLSNVKEDNSTNSKPLFKIYDTGIVKSLSLSIAFEFKQSVVGMLNLNPMIGVIVLYLNILGQVSTKNTVTVIGTTNKLENLDRELCCTKTQKKTHTSLLPKSIHSSLRSESKINETRIQGIQSTQLVRYICDTIYFKDKLKNDVVIAPGLNIRFYDVCKEVQIFLSRVKMDTNRLANY
ncbi:hypothetical protein AGLY_012241 [Aphis glycines]|uniref:Uncharacterized protein n=1 Tax=Aphis glycines TaxID=307491 RepID=A0A6G0T9P1_APHGL|nr:hypothetical protein AGLY_012241 [Aphis glycines]